MWNVAMVAEKQKNQDMMHDIVEHSKTRSVADSPLKLPSELLLAAKLGSAFTVMLWVRAGGSIDATCAGDKGVELSLLTVACTYGQLDLVDKLLEQAATIDLRPDDQPTAIMLAASLGHTPIVQRLCDAGSKDVFHAITWAHTSGAVRRYTVSALSTHIKKVKASCWYDDGEKTPRVITYAAEHGVEATVLAWIEGGGRADATNDTEDKTLLLIACEYNQPSIVSLLIKHGADTNQQDSRGDSPLMESASRGHASIVSRL